jgi:hypothetical protein
MAPAACSFSTTVASKMEWKFSKILEAPDKG